MATYRKAIKRGYKSKWPYGWLYHPLGAFIVARFEALARYIMGGFKRFCRFLGIFDALWGVLDRSRIPRAPFVPDNREDEQLVKTEPSPTTSWRASRGFAFQLFALGS